MRWKPIIPLLVAISIALFICLIWYLRITAPTDKEIAQKAHQKAQKEAGQHLQYTANSTINKIQYIKDPRTNICFALYWNAGSPALATVSCDSIPPELLSVAEIK